jgi:hypothetical protein
MVSFEPIDRSLRTTILTMIHMPGKMPSLAGFLSFASLAIYLAAHRQVISRLPFYREVKLIGVIYCSAQLLTETLASFKPLIQLRPLPLGN